MKRNLLIATILISLVATACDNQSDKPYMKIAGGGFMFNYRYSIMNYGFVVKPLRPLPEGSTLSYEEESYRLTRALSALGVLCAVMGLAALRAGSLD